MAKSQLKIGAIMSYINMAIGSLIPMFYTPLMLDLLGQSEYGLFKLANTVTSYLSLLSFGIGSAVVRYLMMYHSKGDTEGEAKMFGLFNIIFTSISCVVIILGIILGMNIHFFYGSSLNDYELTQLKIMVILFAINTAITFTSITYTSSVMCHERFLFLQFVSIMITIVTPVINLIALFLGFKSVGLVVSTLIVSILIRIIYTIYVRVSIKIKPCYKDMPVHLIKELLVFSFWVFLGNIVNQLYSATDTMIIGAVPALATIGVAIYNVGATFNNMMLNFTTGISNVVTPRINNMVFSGSNTDELTDLLIKVGRLQAYIVTIVCTGFIAFGQQFINLWAGAEYADAYWVALFTMVPSCIPLMQAVALNIIVAQNKHRFRSLVYLAIAIINVVGTALCVNEFGIVGAAVVSCIAYILGQGIVMNLYYWKKIKLDIPRFWGSVIKILLLGIILCVVALFITKGIVMDNWFIMFASIIVYTIIFCILQWLFAMNEYEKGLFINPFKKIIGKVKKQQA